MAIGRPQKYPYGELQQKGVAFLKQQGEFTFDDLRDHLDVPDPVARKVIQNLRRKADDIGLALVTAVEDGKWLYFLTDDPEEMRPWRTMRAKSIESQINTMIPMTALEVDQAPDGSFENRRARLAHRSLRRLAEDLRELREEEDRVGKQAEENTA